MDTNEKALNKIEFWTTDIVLLVILNVVLMGCILFGMALIYMTFSVPVTTWLTRALSL